ncbi:MAG: lysophospholipid acyltransferase family protein [Verrucomicrobia bacterium]|nr:lysophospholipid acyltransferase family protein [Verrucomicrobiota bacterium]
MTQDRLGVVRLTLVTLTSILFWSCSALVFLLMGLLLWPLRRYPGVQRFGQRWLKRAFTGYVQVLGGFGIATCDYSGFEKLQRQAGGYIVAPNHPAMWDVVFLLSKLEPMTCIFKASLIRNPLFSGGAMLAGLIPNAPAIRMVKRAVEVLGLGGRVLFFPEGTRTRRSEGVLNPLQGSMGLVAKHSQLPVWPVLVQTDSAYLSKGWPVWRLPRRKTHLRMRVGEPVICGVDESVSDFNERLRAIYLKSLE